MAFGKAQVVEIKAPNMQVGVFKIQTDALYCQNKFSKKARQMMMDKQEAGSKGKKGKAREAKDFQKCYEESIHKFGKSFGIPAPAFRNAMIDACRLVGFQMTRAKLGVFILADGFDDDDGTPLVKITKGTPERKDLMVRNETGVCDIRPRPFWKPGMEATVRVRYDADMFTVEDIANLLARAGAQVGIGEGRPGSKNSAGMGWGTFTIEEKK